MKLSLLVSLFFLVFSPLSTSAQSSEQSNQRFLGAVVGSVVGSTIGDGDGKKIATVVGAVIGYRFGDKLFGDQFTDASFDDFLRECRRLIPAKYRNNHGAKRSWVDGCVSRLQQEQYELEQQAYNDGAQID